MAWRDLPRLLGLPSDYSVDGAVVKEELATSERSLGVALPKSYHAYARTFGAGRLCRLFYVWPPNALSHRAPQYLAVLTAQIAAGAWSSSGVLPETLGRMLPFGHSDDGDLLCWLRPRARAGQRSSEWDIYVLTTDKQVVLAARNMLGFVEAFCLGGGLERALPIEEGAPLAKDFIPLPDLPRVKLPSAERVARELRDLKLVADKTNRNLEAGISSTMTLKERLRSIRTGKDALTGGAPKAKRRKRK